jgi:4-amino-4-deoxy-L-arabinose transferase-like glycosyltransferase
MEHAKNHGAASGIPIAGHIRTARLRLQVNSVPKAAMETRLQSLLLQIFATALAIRWVYALVLFAAMGESGLKGPDSYSQVAYAKTFAASVVAGTVWGWDWLGPSLITMPLFNWLLALHVLTFGTHAPLTYVLMQGVIDAGTCLLVFGLAATLDKRYAAPAAFVAALNPTQIVLSGLVYTDTAFVFCVALVLLAAVRWLRTGLQTWAVLLGLALGTATLIRIVVVPFAPVMFVILLIGGLLTQASAWRALRQLAVAVAIFAILLAPVVARSKLKYDTWSLTPQGGIHLALWVVPLVKEAKDGTSFARSADDMEKRTRERFGGPAANPYEESRRYTEIGSEAIRTLGAAATAKAWVIGAAINLGAPALTLSPPISQLSRTGFYATTGNTTLEKIGRFIFHSESALYVWTLLIGITGITAARLIQLVGAATVSWRGVNWIILVLFGTWCVYILAANGPVASPKYRLPLEPILDVLAGMGLVALNRARQLRLRQNLN